jgi:hypothetical protein
MPIGFLLGMSLAWLARIELARSEVPLVLARPFLVALGLGGIVYAPIVGYFVVLHGDWSYLYSVRFAQVPSAVDLALVLLVAAQLPIGFAVASPWAMAKRGLALLKASAVIGALLVLGGILAAHRLAVSASYAQYHAGFGAVPLGRTHLGRGILMSWLALFAGYAWSAHVLATGSRSSSSAP